MVERQAEAPVDVGLHRMLARAVLGDRQAGRLRRQLGRRAVLVGAAEEQHLVAGLPAEAGVDVGGQQRAREVAEMLDAVDVGQGAGDQEFGHGTLRPLAGLFLSFADMKKPFAQEGPERAVGLSAPARQRSVPSCRGARRIRGVKVRASANMAGILSLMVRPSTGGRIERDDADGAADQLGARADDLDIAQASSSYRRSCATSATACCPTGRAGSRSGCCRDR